ncbi:MAG: GNAT family N-acetyltransferase [Anaerolineales bacterium]|nr:GNAT family N-acetyltransferase [Chloroflexota bacterium]MBL6981727.1 GNAT family N-acetyltransferase [Anaerolineales bacterium]
MGIVIRQLIRDEIERIWEIDRREIIEGIYYFCDGELVLEEEYYHMGGWPPDESKIYTPILIESFDRGGIFFGAFDSDVLVGAAVLDNKFIGKKNNQLQLKFLHVSHSYRKQGLGVKLFEKAEEVARKFGANKLYVSATPSENTVNFYLRRGCEVTEDVNEELFTLEPEDIHFEYLIK